MWVEMDEDRMDGGCGVLPTVALGQPSVSEGGRHSWGASAATALSFPFPSLLVPLPSRLLSSLSSPQSRSIRGGDGMRRTISRVGS